MILKIPSFSITDILSLATQKNIKLNIFKLVLSHLVWLHNTLDNQQKYLINKIGNIEVTKNTT